MIWLALGLLFIGILLSAFFSGSETGFYRATRVRVMLDAMGGDWIAQGLLWLTNNPALFVATTLIGNNLANYLVSLAIVLGVQQIAFQNSQLAELLAPVLLAPLVFVYGELLPKNLFFYAPNRLLRRAGPLFLMFAALFAPVSAILWGLGRILQWLVGETPLRVQMVLARNELQQVLHEGHAAGVLLPTQRDLAQDLLAVASQKASDWSEPIARLPRVPLGTDRLRAFAVARNQRLRMVLVADQDGSIAGYLRMVDLLVATTASIDQPRPLMQLPLETSHVAALMQMQTNKEDFACLVDDRQRPTSIISLERLTEPLGLK